LTAATGPPVLLVIDMDLPGFRLHPLKGNRKRRLGGDGKGQLASYLPL